LFNFPIFHVSSRIRLSLIISGAEVFTGQVPSSRLTNSIQALKAVSLVLKQLPDKNSTDNYK